jgi:hypothetical protein
MVMRFDGSAWVMVGSIGFSPWEAVNTSLAFSPSGEPYVAFEDGGQSFKATVMKFNGVNWVNVGIPGFSIDIADFINLAFSPTESQPYIAYKDFGNSVKATVMKFDGNNWVNVGNAGFSAARVEYINLAFNASGTPYVAYADWGSSEKATVMKFNATNWVNVGNAGFSESPVIDTDLAFSLNNEPYLAYSNRDNLYAYLMQYDSVYIGVNEPLKQNLSIYPNPSTTIVTINFNVLLKKIITVEILDVRGITMFETEITENTFKVDVKNYPTGIYFIKMKSGNSNYFGKFCKN